MEKVYILGLSTKIREGRVNATLRVSKSLKNLSEVMNYHTGKPFYEIEENLRCCGYSEAKVFGEDQWYILTQHVLEE